MWSLTGLRNTCPLDCIGAVTRRRRMRDEEDFGITGTPAFVVGSELAPGALDMKGLKDLIALAGEKK